MLHYPNWDSKFIVQTDASAKGLGAVLTQIDNAGKERPVRYASLDATLAALRSRYYWPGMVRDTSRWVKKCVAMCQTENIPTSPRSNAHSLYIKNPGKQSVLTSSDPFPKHE